MNASDAAHCPIEIVRADHPRGPFRVAMFDHDGTLSLLRGNWQEIMTELMVEALGPFPEPPPTALLDRIEAIVAGMAGRPTIEQMIALKDEIIKRGGTPHDPQVYLERFTTRLGVKLSERLASIESGRTHTDELMVCGARGALDALRSRGLQLCLASGTELRHVQNELALLGIADRFGDWVFGPGEATPKFSKRDVVRRLLEEGGIKGEELIGVGDGPVETEAVKRVGGLAVGVACDETTRCGLDARKRRWLVGAGADIIIADYCCLPELLALILPRA